MMKVAGDLLGGTQDPAGLVGELESQESPVLAPDALAALNAHRWPGNVRELRNVIERTLAFEPMPPVLSAEHLRITV
jgi:transcriptional regulator with PAS, ATPase and Fis domain